MMKKSKDEKIQEQVRILKDYCETWLMEVDFIGNQCAHTDRGVEDILGAALGLAAMYNEDIIFTVEKYPSEDAYLDGPYTWTSVKKFRDFYDAEVYFEEKSKEYKTGMLVLAWQEGEDAEHANLVKKRILGGKKSKEEQNNMVKVYYGNDYKEAYREHPLYTNDAKQILGYQNNYAVCVVEDITYTDIQYGMSDEQRLKLYKDETGETLDKVDDRFWDWAEENYEC